MKGRDDKRGREWRGKGMHNVFSYFQINKDFDSFIAHPTTLINYLL